MSEKIKILVIDDEPDLLELYVDSFRESGFEVFSAASGEEALTIYEKNKAIKIIIADSNMDKMSGMDLLNNLKEKYQMIPNFYLATGELEIKKETVIRAGGNGIFLKPFDVDEIVEIIKKY